MNKSKADNASVIQIAMALHQQGNLSLAKEIYEKIPPSDPQYAESLHLIGVILFQTQKHEEAISFILKSLEINPNNALFVGWIENPTKEAPKSCDFVSHEDAKIIHSVIKTNDSWSGKMQIPWTLIGGKKNAYRVNFYRIISLKSHSKSDWAGTPATCAYLCWSPTMSGAVPRFHRPEAFGILKVEK